MEGRTVVTAPKEGWAYELKKAEGAAKKDARNAAKQLRVAKAAHALRQWKKCKTVAQLGLLFEPQKKDRKQLRTYLNAAKAELAIYSGVDQQWFQKEVIENVMSGGNLDEVAVSLPEFTNLNILQCAAIIGDVRMLDSLVSLGAALDYPVLDINDPNKPPSPAPAGSTALVLVCAALAIVGHTTTRHASSSGNLHPGTYVCAIRLVMLGANYKSKLQLPPRSLNEPHMVTVYRKHGLNGMTAQELAMRSGQANLINAMERMESEENKIALTQCRCGSQLPWKQCHSGRLHGESPFYVQGEEGFLHWRYSPLAPCPCKLSTKTYFDCCWKQTSNPTYQVDSSGEFFFHRVARLSGVTESYIEMRREEIEANGEDPNAELFPFESKEDARAQTANFIRAAGSNILQEIASSIGPMCQIGTWDPYVYAGCVERLDDCFLWDDCHWKLDKTELLQRTKEWNTALEQYCNDIGLTGKERASILTRHTASPLAPCANPSCSEVEKKVKEFRRAACCKCVAYCSSACQRQHWKQDHKQKCSKK